MYRLPADIYAWLDHMEAISDRSYDVDGMHVFEMDTRTRVVVVQHMLFAHVLISNALLRK